MRWRNSKSSPKTAIARKPYTFTTATHIANEFSSTEQNQRTSPLLRLPPELRNRIYGYVFEPRVSRVIFPSTELGYTTWPLTTLGACRQIRYEASPICFANITFDLRPFKYNDNPLEILALGPFVSVTVKDGTANFLMDVTRSASEFHYAALFRERVKSLKRIYITAPGGAEVELAFDKESGLCKYGV
jgi:hypothetical protein